MCLANQEVVLELISFIQRALPETMFTTGGTGQVERSDPVEDPPSHQVRSYYALYKKTLLHCVLLRYVTGTFGGQDLERVAFIGSCFIHKLIIHSGAKCSLFYQG